VCNNFRLEIIRKNSTSRIVPCTPELLNTGALISLASGRVEWSTCWYDGLGWVYKLIGGFKGEGKGVISTPQLAPQQVPGEAIWHLYNARKSDCPSS